MKSKGYITGLKGAGHKQLLFILSSRYNLDFKILEEDKGWFMSTIYYQVKGKINNIYEFNESVKEAVKKYNETFNN